MWLGRRYERNRRSNITNTKPVHLRPDAPHAKELKLSTDGMPFPGMELQERVALNRVCAALGELEDMAARRSIPPTALLKRMFVVEGAVAPVRWHSGMSRAEICTLRDVARSNLYRCCVLLSR